MLNRDDLSETIHELKQEFEKSGQKKFAYKCIATYDELSFDIVKRYMRKFNAFVAKSTDQQAEILYKRRHFAQEVRRRDGLSDEETTKTEWVDEYKVYVIWTGKLPPVH